MIKDRSYLVVEAKELKEKCQKSRKMPMSITSKQSERVGKFWKFCVTDHHRPCHDCDEDHRVLSTHRTSAPSPVLLFLLHQFFESFPHLNIIIGIIMVMTVIIMKIIIGIRMMMTAVMILMIMRIIIVDDDHQLYG